MNTNLAGEAVMGEEGGKWVEGGKGEGGWDVLFHSSSLEA